MPPTRTNAGLPSPVWRGIRGKTRSHASRALAFALLSAVAVPAVAQSNQGERAAQELQRQQERERALRERLERTPEVRLAAPKAEEERLPEGEAPCFAFREIRLDDPSGRFTWAVEAADRPGDPATGRCLGSQGINRVMARIQNAIVARGYVTTRVLAAPQDLSAGVLTLTVLPGRIRAIRFTDDSDPRATAWNAFPAAPGDLLNLRDLEQALENFKRVPTAETDIRIVPADAPGESDVVIAWKQAFPLRVTLSVNDGGNRATGRFQGSVTVSGDHLATLNDLFYVTHSQDLGGGQAGERGTHGHTVHYSLPWGYWTLGLTSSANRYHQTVAGINQTYVYSGTSENHEAKLTRLVHRDATGKTSVHARGYLTTSRNFIDDTEIGVQRRRMAGWEAGIAHRQHFGESTLDAALAWRRGTRAFAALPAPEEASGDGTARPSVLTTDGMLNVPFTLGGQSLRYSLAWRGQWNHTPLVPQDRFSIGGRYTVRGFDGESVLMAERGWLLRNDLGFAVGGGQELYLGLDHGEVGGRSAALLPGRRLTGAVLGLRGAYQGMNWDFFAGTPLQKPEGFRTASTTAGFTLTFSF